MRNCGCTRLKELFLRPLTPGDPNTPQVMTDGTFHVMVPITDHPGRVKRLLAHGRELTQSVFDDVGFGAARAIERRACSDCEKTRQIEMIEDWKC